MAIEMRDNDLKLVRERDGLSVNMRPLQGLWTEEQYLTLTDHTRHLIEFTDGMIEVLPMPTDQHQAIIALLYELLTAFLRPRGGRALLLPCGSRYARASSASRISCSSATPKIRAGRTASGSASRPPPRHYLTILEDRPGLREVFEHAGFRLDDTECAGRLICLCLGCQFVLSFMSGAFAV